MATVITGSSPVSRTPTYASKGSSTVSFGGGYLFFSDCPEAVATSDLADNGRWLNQATVNGSGLAYLWHTNSTGSTIHSCLAIYNPNNFPITVTSANHGTTNASAVGDVNAWASYFITSSTSIVISALGWGIMFAQTVPSGYNFGVIAGTNVTNSSGASASAIFYDLAYLTNSSGATAFATATGEMKRGHGAHFYNTLSFAQISPMNSDGIGYKIAASGDVFSGSDLVYITDDSGQTSGPLEGSYGQQLVVTLPIYNSFSVAKIFNIYIGSTGGYSFPIVSLNGFTAKYNGWAPAYQYVDMISTGSVASGSTATVTFFTCVPAESSTPYVIGARVV